MPVTDGLLAATLAGLLDGSGGGLLHISSSEGKAERLQRLLAAMRPDAEIMVLPAWDCFPFDRLSPSRHVMGRRIAAIAALAKAGDRARLLLAVPDALLQKVVPPQVFEEATIHVAVGDEPDFDALIGALERIGYIQDDRIDEPGEVALRGQVVDVFPAGLAQPVRIEHADGAITRIQAFDATTQRTDQGAEELPELLIRPVSEAILPAPDEGSEPVQRHAGMEHRLPEHHPVLNSVFDLIPDYTISLEAGAEERRAAFLEQIAESFAGRSRLAGGEARPLPPDRLYLDKAAFAAALSAHPLVTFAESGEAGDERVPLFAGEARPNAAFAAFVSDQIEAGRRVVLAAANPAAASTLARRCEAALSRLPEAATAWPDVLAAEAGTLLALPLDLATGFVDEAGNVAVIAAADLLGSRALAGEASSAPSADLATDPVAYKLGDAVIHLDHGVGMLEGLESVPTGEGGLSEAVRLRYAGEAALMVPVEQIDRMWRYGSLEKGVVLDRLGGEAWPKRRAKVEAEIAQSAAELVGLARAREDREAARLVPPRRDYERFVARFPFAETRDQNQAIAAVLADLGSGRAMDRLLCGDVGFGKTEVALRAAAACALAGKQVALIAPTTVLVRQHVETFRRRFADLGVAVAHLSRLVTGAEARQVKAGLASGEIRIVIGTQALAAKGVRFADLGLVIIDEEQHFGTADKARLRALAEGVHVLTLTATPIPRSYQSALVGLQDLSLLTTPPAERRPIRTVVTPFDRAGIREALLREHRRGGQSFVVCPRVTDIEPLAELLRKLVPELGLAVAHGKMPAAQIDEAMVRFAEGAGDVLLATNIIESGLDVPRANTMIVWRPDRFGLSQLHQLRGRVGRGRLRGTCLLMTDPETELPAATAKRLQTLERLDGLGAGFAISARDLDLRGAGDLLGDDQAGHVKLIGPALYRRMLERALAAARGEPLPEEGDCDLRLGILGSIPADYVPEPELRLNLYAQIARVTEARETKAFAEEIEDRFGPLPEPVHLLIALAQLRDRGRRRGIARIDAGPDAIALTFHDRSRGEAALARLADGSDGAPSWKGERLIWTQPSETQARVETVSSLLSRLPAAAG